MYEDGSGISRDAMSGPSARVDRRGAVTLLPHTPVVGEAVTGDPD